MTFYYASLHITGLAHPSISLSICSVWAANSKTKWCRKTKIGINVVRGNTEGCD